jgi:hypothetical protein
VKRSVLLAAILMLAWPAASFAQSRIITVRPNRSRVVIYQTQPSVIYQRRRYNSYRSYYNYPRSYYSGYYSSGYSQPYYSNRYYSYRYSQPYFVNRYNYDSAYQYYGDGYYRDGYYRRPRRSGLSIRIGLR